MSSESCEGQKEMWKFDHTSETQFCQYWIKRKQRKCSHRVADGSTDGFCTEHSASALAESRRIAEEGKVLHECREVLLQCIKQIDPDGDSVGQGTKRKRTRGLRVSAPKRMANPFSVDLTPSLGNIDTCSWYSDPTLPLHIDVGCARGRCIERLAYRPEREGWNHLGVEIRPNTVAEAMQRVQNTYSSNARESGKQAKKNIHFLACNFVASMNELLSAFPRGALRLISIQFPDPWRRKRHLKRMLVQPQLVRDLASHISPGALVYLSSDCTRVAMWMLKTFLEQNDNGKPFFRLVRDLSSLSSNCTPNAFIASGATVGTRGGTVEGSQSNSAQNSEERSDACHEDDGSDSEDSDNGEDYSGCWLGFNPLGELSERELVCEVDWRQVKRCVLERI